MRKVLLFTVLFLSVLSATTTAQTEYKAVGNNLITNSTFSSDINGWTSSPPNNAENEGWRWDDSFTYGSTLWIDRYGTTTAISNTMTLCSGYPKEVKFSFTSPNRGDYEMLVKLGGQLLGTFTNNGNSPRSIFTPATGVATTILCNYFPSYYVTDGKIENDIWHEFTFTIDNYTGTTSGSLTFEYTKTGISRPVYIDHVKVYELIPTPVPTQITVYASTCGGTYNLTQLNPTDTKYTYTWYRSTNTAMTNQVSDPTKAEVGTYYLFARSTCTGTDNYSYPSTAVTVNPKVGCCGSNVVLDGTFSETDPSNSPTGYLVPKGDNTDGGGVYWKRNYTNKDQDFHIAPSITLTNGTMTNAVKMISKAGQNSLIYQRNSNIDRWMRKVVEFDFAFSPITDPKENGIFAVYLKPGITSINGGWNNSTTFGPYIAEFTKDKNSNKVWVSGIPSGIIVKVDGVPATVGNINNAIYTANTLYRITIEVPANYGNSATDYYGGIGFWGSKEIGKGFDNVRVESSNPDAPILTNNTVVADCLDESGNLTTLSVGTNITNYLSTLQYRWFITNSSEGAMVPDPLKAAPGTYYLFAFNPATGCYSYTGTRGTVVLDCPVINGTVYHDWDGVNTGGIDNQLPIQDAVVYPLLVNPANNQVVKSMQLNTDGTYSFVGVKNTQYYVMITHHETAAGTTVPTAPAYPSGSSPTGETVNGTLDGTANGKSTTFTTGTNSTSVTTINFGVNRVPIQDHITDSICGNQPIELTSIESEPDWNGGIGKKLIIHSITSSINGTLTYDGIAVSAPQTINEYDPTKLKFERIDMLQRGKVEFGYAFEDAAGQSTLNVVTPPEPAIVSYTFKVVPVIADASINVQSRVSSYYKPKNGVNGDIVPPGTRYSWVPMSDSIWGVGGMVADVDQDSVYGTIYNYCPYPHSIEYNVTATTPEGCTDNFILTVNVARDDDNCGQVAYGLFSGVNRGLDLGKVVDAPADKKGNLADGVISNPNLTGTKAIAIYQTDPHFLYYIPYPGTHVHIYDNTLATGVIVDDFKELPKVNNVYVDVTAMAFDKKGNLWIVDTNNTMWMLPPRADLGVLPRNPATDWGTTWENHGKILDIPAGGVGDITFNWTGSMYFVANDASNNGYFYIITPLKLIGSKDATPEQIVQVTTGRTVTGLASHMHLETFFISATDGTNSYIYELNQKTGNNAIEVTLLKTHTGKVIGDLTSCGLPQNLWIGTTSTSLAEPANWIYNLVPRKGEDIEFANGYANNAKGKTAQNNIEIPSGIVKEIGSLINETSYATVISPNASLTVHGNVVGSSTDPNKLVVKASETLPNGTLILAGQPCDSLIMGTVEMYAKGYQLVGDTAIWTDNIPGSPTIGQTFKSTYHWQYFGIPVQSIITDPTFYGSFIRKYNESINGTSYYQKWEPLNNSSVLTAFTGYEITQKTQKFIHMQGALVFCNDTLTMTRKAPAVSGASGANINYGLGQNIFGNSYTAAIRIDSIKFPPGNLVEKTVYLYNTGRFGDWGNAASIPNSGTISAGSYTAIPADVASTVWDNQIPSMQGFLLKFTQDETTYNGSDAKVILPYGSGKVVPNTKPQLVKGQQEGQRVVQLAGGTADLKSAEQEEEKAPLSYLRINLASKSTRDVLWLFSQEGTTEGFDNGWDGRKFFGTPKAFIYTETPDGPMQVSTNRTINGTYLTLYSNADTEYTLTLAKSNLDDYTDLVLHDLKTGTKTPLNNDLTEYKFTSHNTGKAEKRFLITGHKPINNEDENSLSGYYITQAQTLVLTNNSDEEGTYSIYTTTGSLVKIEKLTVGTHSYLVLLTPGTYLVHLQAGTERGIVKMVVIN
ncbi:MAG TPA: T9SS type A sorting domain-containing protein [Bacteroidales bacterium]|nr:T9SS type A sorting domain-containing protein [Bacteroidales bacterium]